MDNKKYFRCSNIFFRLICFSALLVLAMAQWTCKGSPTSSDSDIVAGITGIVYDSTGHRLDSVQVYCQYQFNYSYVPSIKQNQSITNHSNSVLAKITSTGTFNFALEQNIPNPVQNSTYLQFSLPTASTVRIAVADRFDGKEKYSYSASLSDGMYQLYLNNFVDSLMLHNGPYTYSITVNSNNGAHYSASKEMFVISSSGRPAIVTQTDGLFVFDYRHAFVGDSVVINGEYGYSTYTMFLGNTITLLFERSGYQSQSLNVDLNSNILFHQDIILVRRY